MSINLLKMQKGILYSVLEKYNIQDSITPLQVVRIIAEGNIFKEDMDIIMYNYYFTKSLTGNNEWINLN
jgi:hypothetical protein